MFLEPSKKAPAKKAKAKKVEVKKAEPVPTLDELIVAQTDVEKGQKWRAEQEARHGVGTSTAADFTREESLAKLAKEREATPADLQAEMAAKNAAKLANWQAQRRRKHAGVG